MPRMNPDDPKSPAPGMPVPAVAIEAVYKQILESLATSSRNSESFCVLHISSCQVAAEGHFERIAEMAKLAGVRVVRLHGGVSCADKARAMKTPTGILLTTPEALEAFVVIRAQQLPSLFRHLQYMIVEESDTISRLQQGRELQSVLTRVDLAIESSPRRILLSTSGVVEYGTK